jgi:plastocyanin
MNKNIIIGIAFLVVLAALYLIFYGNRSDTQYESPPSPTPENPSENIVTIKNFAFSPTPLTVSEGATVTWVNEDDAPHQIDSDAFSSSSLSRGAIFSYTFDQIGTYDYSCGIHPSMKGVIVVK